MTSITKEEIYSRFFTKVEAYDLIDIPDDMAAQILCNYLLTAQSYPYIRRLFSSFELDEDYTATYELKYPIDEMSDKLFVLDVQSWGMVLGWVDPKVNSLTNIAQAFGTSDEKYYSQSAHLSELRALRDDTERRLRAMIRDRGYANNDYLDGNAASANIKTRS